MTDRGSRSPRRARRRGLGRRIVPTLFTVLVAATGRSWAADGAAEAPRAGVAGTGVEQGSELGLLRSLRDGSGALPFTIESGELELRAQPDESRVLLFLHGVVVRYGETELHSDQLEAYYPPQESEPSRMLARGNVRIDQREQRATCAEAEYRRDGALLICRGQARLSNGCDVVEGDSIELDLAAERARVVGAARVVIAPRGDVSQCPKLVPSGSAAP